MGSGKGEKLVFGVIMGTGCGGGLVIDGSVIRGAQYLGGEVGHVTLHPNGVDCFCKKKVVQSDIFPEVECRKGI